MKQEKKCKTMIMNGNKNIKVLAATILSMSLLTVMAGAAVAPALGAVKAYFADADPLLVQLVVSMPALFIILTNLIFPKFPSSFESLQYKAVLFSFAVCLAIFYLLVHKASQLFT